MNLGRRRITNVELVRCFEELGFDEVNAFLASGNVVFSSRSRPAALIKKLESGLSAALDYEVPTFLRTEKEVLDIAKARPFEARKGKQGGKVQVAFLRSPPNKGKARELLAFESGADWLCLSGTQLYWWPRGGISESELDLKGLEKLLGPFSIRTQGTVERMALKYFS